MQEAVVGNEERGQRREAISRQWSWVVPKRGCMSQTAMARQDCVQQELHAASRDEQR